MSTRSTWLGKYGYKWSPHDQRYTYSLVRWDTIWIDVSKIRDEARKHLNQKKISERDRKFFEQQYRNAEIILLAKPIWTDSGGKGQDLALTKKAIAERLAPRFFKGHSKAALAVVRRIIRAFRRDSGGPQALVPKRAGRKVDKNSVNLSRLRALRAEFPDDAVSALREVWEERYGQAPHRATLYRLLANLGLSR